MRVGIQVHNFDFSSHVLRYNLCSPVQSTLSIRTKCWWYTGPVTFHGKYLLRLCTGAAPCLCPDIRESMWMQRVTLLLAACCLTPLLRKTMAARCGTAVDSDPHRVQDNAGPSSSIVTVGLPGTAVGNIKISSGQLTVPGCSTSDRFGLVLFHSGFSVRCVCFLSALYGLEFAMNCHVRPFRGCSCLNACVRRSLT